MSRAAALGLALAAAAVLLFAHMFRYESVGQDKFLGTMLWDRWRHCHEFRGVADTEYAQRQLTSTFADFCQ